MSPSRGIGEGSRSLAREIFVLFKVVFTTSKYMASHAARAVCVVFYGVEPIFFARSPCPRRADLEGNVRWRCLVLSGAGSLKTVSARPLSSITAKTPAVLLLRSSSSKNIQVRFRLVRYPIQDKVSIQSRRLQPTTATQTRGPQDKP